MRGIDKDGYAYMGPPRRERELGWETKTVEGNLRRGALIGALIADGLGHGDGCWTSRTCRLCDVGEAEENLGTVKDWGDSVFSRGIF